MKQKHSIALVLSAVAGLASPSGAFTVTPSADATALASAVVGTGVTVVGGSQSYSDNSSGIASGTFTGGLSTGIGIEEGIILTTGLASSAVGPNSSDSTSGSGNYTSLSFDFTTDSGDLFFNYVFASEEYNEFADSQFNDLFQLLVDGVNVAIIPGTSEAVSINNVNGTADDHPELFNNNDPSDLGTPPYDIEYDGFTDVFTAQALGLGAGTHTIEFRIQDIGDSSWDSAVFIEGSSFSSEPPPPSVPDSGSTLALFGLAMAGLTGSRRFKRKG